jgi:hypothetical protein
VIFLSDGFSNNYIISFEIGSGVEGHFMDQICVFSESLEVEKYLSKNEIKSGHLLDGACFGTTYIQCFCFVAQFLSVLVHFVHILDLKIKKQKLQGSFIYKSVNYYCISSRKFH